MHHWQVTAAAAHHHKRLKVVSSPLDLCAGDEAQQHDTCVAPHIIPEVCQQLVLCDASLNTCRWQHTHCLRYSSNTAHGRPPLSTNCSSRIDQCFAEPASNPTEGLPGCRNPAASSHCPGCHISVLLAVSHSLLALWCWCLTCGAYEDGLHLLQQHIQGVLKHDGIIPSFCQLLFPALKTCQEPAAIMRSQNIHQCQHIGLGSTLRPAYQLCLVAPELLSGLVLLDTQ